MSPSPGLAASNNKEDNPTLRLIADRLVCKLTALVPHLHSVHYDVTGSFAPTDTPTPAAQAQGGNPNTPSISIVHSEAAHAIPSIADSLAIAHAIVNQMEEDLLALRGKV